MPREAKPRCGYFRTEGGKDKEGKGRGAPMTAPCDLAAGHQGRHHSGRVENEEKPKIPDHPRAWTNRERNWRYQGILCLPGCVRNRGFLCREHYKSLLEYQGGKCGLCGGILFLGVKPYPSSDHQHANPDGSGPIRGILHGGKIGCNTRFLGGYESGKRFNPILDALCAAYVASPPSAKLAALEGTPFPEGTCFVSVIPPSKGISLDSFGDSSIARPSGDACPGRVGSVYGEESHDRA